MSIQMLRYDAELEIITPKSLLHIIIEIMYRYIDKIW